MKEETKRVVQYVIDFATVGDLKGSFVISEKNNTLIGIDIRFDPPLDLDKFPSLKKAMALKEGSG